MRKRREKGRMGKGEEGRKGDICAEGMGRIGVARRRDTEEEGEAGGDRTKRKEGSGEEGKNRWKEWVKDDRHICSLCERRCR